MTSIFNSKNNSMFSKPCLALVLGFLEVILISCPYEIVFVHMRAPFTWVVYYNLGWRRWVITKGVEGRDLPQEQSCLHNEAIIKILNTKTYSSFPNGKYSLSTIAQSCQKQCSDSMGRRQWELCSKCFSWLVLISKLSAQKAVHVYAF